MIIPEIIVYVYVWNSIKENKIFHICQQRDNIISIRQHQY